MDSIPEKDFRKHAEEAYPEECCGVIVVFKGRQRYVPCRNVAATPTLTFKISQEDYSNAEDLGEIIAICHSHPNKSSKPSEADLTEIEILKEAGYDFIWYITGVFNDAGVVASTDITKTVSSGYKAPLIGRSFSHGILDCYTLIRDWYKEEHGIELPQFKRDDDWWNDGKSDLYREGFPQAGFVSIGQSASPEIGDVILMQVRSKNMVPNHAGIYIGNSMILHHLYGRLSSRDIYGGQWREATTDILRYKG